MYSKVFLLVGILQSALGTPLHVERLIDSQEGLRVQSSDLRLVLARIAHRGAAYFWAVSSLSS